MATRTDANYHHALVLLDAQTGAEIQTLPNPQNDFYQQPRWHPDGRRVVAVSLRQAGKTIVVIDLATGTTQDLLPVANVNLANPLPWRGFVLYNSSQSGIDNLYAVSARTGQTYRVTSRPLGAYHAAVAPDGRTLAFHDYRATGARVVEMPLDTTAWMPIATAKADIPGPYAAALTAREPAGELLTQLTQPEAAAPRYGVQRYSPLRHAFNVFSYGVVQSPMGNAVSLGIRSQDLLNTTQVFAGVGYDQVERTASVVGALSYQALYPVLDVDVTYGGRDAAIIFRGQTLRDQWQYTRLSAGLRLPLNLTHSKYFQGLTIGTYFLHEKVFDYNLPVRRRTETGPNSPLNAVQTTVSYASQLKRSARDVAPRWGSSFLGTWRTTPFGSGLEATQWARRVVCFCRGWAATMRCGCGAATSGKTRRSTSLHRPCRFRGARAT
ncbi:TolB family protein [Hymenobacter humi]|uniref:TolB family protein n=1 Tax=Hymenobacter humi TaxID=1411620 RepID=A0ABW2U040_9BACT